LIKKPSFESIPSLFPYAMIACVGRQRTKKRRRRTMSYKNLSQGYMVPDQPHREPIVSPAAIAAAGLASATAALIRPYFDFGTGEAIIGAAFTAMVVTTSSALYKAYLERSRSWSTIILVGMSMGLIVCFLSIGGVSAAELAAGREPSIVGGSLIPDVPDSCNLIDGIIERVRTQSAGFFTAEQVDDVAQRVKGVLGCP
jgi:hypothetical protein